MRQKRFLTFNEAKKIVRSLNLNTAEEYRKSLRSSDEYFNIPICPYIVYKDEWVNWEDWLNNGEYKKQARAKAQKNRKGISKFPPFEEARETARQLGFQNREEYFNYIKKNDVNLPIAPWFVYKKDWKGYADFLGNNNIRSARQDRTLLLPFEEAKRLVQQKNFVSASAYIAWAKDQKEFPSHPEYFYKNEWTNWKDWLGYDRKLRGGRKGDFLPFEEAKEFIRSLNLSGQIAFKKWYAENNGKSYKIPCSPNTAYKDQWINWKDWLGNGRRRLIITEALPFKKARAYIRKLKLGSRNQYVEWFKSDDRNQKIPFSPERFYKKDWQDWDDWLGIKIRGQQPCISQSTPNYPDPD